MTKFTPGPHTVNEYDDGFWICSNGGDNLSYIEKGEDVSLPQDAANATLFAAAPEMYEVLDRIADKLVSDDGVVTGIDAADAVIVLRKARGEL